MHSAERKRDTVNVGRRTKAKESDYVDDLRGGAGAAELGCQEPWQGAPQLGSFLAWVGRQEGSDGCSCTERTGRPCASTRGTTKGMKGKEAKGEYKRDNIGGRSASAHGAAAVISISSLEFEIEAGQEGDESSLDSHRFRLRQR